MTMIIPMGTGCITYQQNTLERALSFHFRKKGAKSLFEMSDSRKRPVWVDRTFVSCFCNNWLKLAGNQFFPLFPLSLLFPPDLRCLRDESAKT